MCTTLSDCLDKLRRGAARLQLQKKTHVAYLTMFLALSVVSIGTLLTSATPFKPTTYVKVLARQNTTTPNLDRTVLVVLTTTRAPTKYGAGYAARIDTLARGALSVGVDMWLLIHRVSPSDSSPVLDRLCNGLGTSSINSSSSNMATLRCVYQLPEETKALYPNYNFRCCKNRIFWCYEPERINAWLRIPSLHFLVRNYEYFWRVEDDVGFSGNFGNFLEGHQNSSSDLIALTDLWPKNETDNHWAMRCSSIKLGSNLPHYFSFEFVQRLSRRLLDEIHFNSLHGRTSNGELSPPTHCFYNQDTWGCSFERMSSLWRGSTLTWNGRVSEEQWQNMSETQPDKLFHALKF